MTFIPKPFSMAGAPPHRREGLAEADDGVLEALRSTPRVGEEDFCTDW
ncbi:MULTISPECIES: hypothetical protein [Streptomyces]